MTTTEPKEIARQARLLLGAAKALKLLIVEVTAPELNTKKPDRGYDDAEWVRWCNMAIETMLKEALTAPGLRVAIFPETEPELEGKQKTGAFV